MYVQVCREEREVEGFWECFECLPKRISLELPYLKFHVPLIIVGCNCKLFLSFLSPSTGFSFLFSFQLDLTRSNGTFLGTEVPHVVVPLNLSMCETRPPSVEAQVTTCDILPQAAKTATNAFPDTLTCKNLPKPNCDTIQCLVVSNNDSFTFQLLPCHTPPAIRLSNRDVHGKVKFNQTFTRSAVMVNASIGLTPAILNVTIKQYNKSQALGVAVSATLHYVQAFRSRAIALIVIIMCVCGRIHCAYTLCPDQCHHTRSEW